MVSQTSCGPSERPVVIPSGRRRLSGSLAVPPRARGVVVFAHGSGSGRLSPRDQLVARVLQRAGLATLRPDLLEQGEADDRDVARPVPGPSRTTDRGVRKGGERLSG
jgi:putative phosphoribosyl transferase